MKTIILNDFEGFDFTAVYRCIMSDPDLKYEIQLKKRYFGKKEHYSTFQNFSSAAFIGQKLAEVSKLFTYWVPTTLVHDPFIFQVEVTDPETFVDVVSYIISSYINYFNLEISSKFEAAVLAFHKMACEYYADRACWGLIEVADEYKTKHERSEKRKARKARREAWRLRHPFFKFK